jgi:hypothetical protein
VVNDAIVFKMARQAHLLIFSSKHQFWARLPHVSPVRCFEQMDHLSSEPSASKWYFEQMDRVNFIVGRSLTDTPYHVDDLSDSFRARNRSLPKTITDVTKLPTRIASRQRKSRGWKHLGEEWARSPDNGSLASHSRNKSAKFILSATAVDPLSNLGLIIRCLRGSGPPGITVKRVGFWLGVVCYFGMLLAGVVHPSVEAMVTLHTLFKKQIILYRIMLFAVQIRFACRQFFFFSFCDRDTGSYSSNDVADDCVVAY